MRICWADDDGHQTVWSTVNVRYEVENGNSVYRMLMVLFLPDRAMISFYRGAQQNCVCEQGGVERCRIKPEST